MSTTPDRTRPERHPSQWLSLVVGVLYVLFGIAGLASLATVPFAGPEGMEVAGFSENGLHGLLALLVGVGGLLAFARLPLATRYGWLLAVVMFALAAWGTFIDLDSPANVLAFDDSDVGRSVITAVFGLTIGLWPATSPATASAEPGQGRRR